MHINWLQVQCMRTLHGYWLCIMVQVNQKNYCFRVPMFIAQQNIYMITSKHVGLYFSNLLKGVAFDKKVNSESTLAFRMSSSSLHLFLSKHKRLESC